MLRRRRLVSGIHALARRGQHAAVVVRHRPAPLRSTRTLVMCCIYAVALAALAALTACGSTSPGAGAAPTSSRSTPTDGTATSSAAVITIQDFAFTTSPSVSPGVEITVHNKDGLAHTVTADGGGGFDSPAPAGDSRFSAPTTPGSYPFHCNIHPEMHGTLVVG